jgi:hypothetical protein
MCFSETSGNLCGVTTQKGVFFKKRTRSDSTNELLNLPLETWFTGRTHLQVRNLKVTRTLFHTYRSFNAAILMLRALHGLIKFQDRASVKNLQSPMRLTPVSLTIDPEECHLQESDTM